MFIDITKFWFGIEVSAYPDWSIVDVCVDRWCSLLFPPPMAEDNNSPQDLVDEFKRSGEFDRLRNAILEKLLSSVWQFLLH